MSKEEIIKILTDNLENIEYILVANYISKIEKENQELKDNINKYVKVLDLTEKEKAREELINLRLNHQLEEQKKINEEHQKLNGELRKENDKLKEMLANQRSTIKSYIDINNAKEK